jgi:DNA-binding MarR family transcriptional regulator
MAQDVRLLLSRVFRTVTRHFQDRAAEMDLSVVQGQALLMVTANPGINVGGLAAALSKDQASTSIIVDRLMTMGLLRRETDPADRRRAQLYITEPAEPIVEQMEIVRDDINRLVYSALGEERSETLQALLKEFLDAVEGGEMTATATAGATDNDS